MLSNTARAARYVAKHELTEQSGDLETRGLDFSAIAKGMLRALMESSKTEEEWNANCNTVKTLYKGYPPFWFEVILDSGVLREVFKKIKGDTKNG